MHPQIVAATSTILLLFGSSSVALSFYINGMLNISYIQVGSRLSYSSLPRDKTKRFAHVSMFLVHAKRTPRSAAQQTRDDATYGPC